MRRAFPTMGTVVSLVIDADPGGRLEAAVREEFTRWDAAFSLYRPDSELRRIADGHLRLMAASSWVRGVYASALAWSSLTMGAFTPHRPDGVLDLSGIVKALAIDSAGAILDSAGCAGWVVNCGGDALERRPPHESPSTVGIADPSDSGRLLTAVTLRPPWRAIATSGVGERGEHVWGPSVAFGQVTVMARGIVEADVLATAILAGGDEVLDHVTGDRDIDVFAVRKDGTFIATPGTRFSATVVQR